MTAVTDIDWVVISLKRTPERLRVFRATHDHLRLPIEPFEAVDGLDVDRDELARDGIASADLNWGRGAIGAALSHRACWLRSAESGRALCIFEDDIVLRQDFAAAALGVVDALPAGWDLVLFGVNTDSIFDFEIFPGCVATGSFALKRPTVEDCSRFAAGIGYSVPVRLRNAFGTSSYLISPQGARKLIDGCFPLAPLKTPVPLRGMSYMLPTLDALMNRHYSAIGAYVSVPPIAISPNDKETSTIQVR